MRRHLASSTATVVLTAAVLAACSPNEPVTPSAPGGVAVDDGIAGPDDAVDEPSADGQAEPDTGTDHGSGGDTDAGADDAGGPDDGADGDGDGAEGDDGDGGPSAPDDGGPSAGPDASSPGDASGDDDVGEPPEDGADDPPEDGPGEAPEDDADGTDGPDGTDDAAVTEGRVELDVTQTHPDGVTVRVVAIETDGDTTFVEIEVTNDSGDDVSLARGRAASSQVVVGDEAPFLLRPPEDNATLTIPEAGALQARLTYDGAVRDPDVPVTVRFNHTPSGEPMAAGRGPAAPTFLFADLPNPLTAVPTAAAG